MAIAPSTWYGDQRHLHGDIQRLVALKVDFLGRNSTAGGFFAFSWDGRLVTTAKKGKLVLFNMPNGDYKLRVEVLKPREHEPTDVETYTSPTFTIARP